LDRLRRCIVSRIRHALDELPETLDETYERTLLDIDKENWTYAYRLFQCLVVAVRPLRVEELAEFLAFEFEEGGTAIFQADCRPSDPRDAVLSTCSSLIAVVDNAFFPTIVQFSHFSVKEYLTSTRIAEGRVPRYYIPLEPAHFLVTRVCLSILLQLGDQIREELVKDFPLLEYAARSWAEHAKFGDALAQTEDMVKRLFDPRNPHFTLWISLRNLDTDSRNESTPLYYAALLNFCGVAEWLVNMHSQNVNAFGGEHGTPLHAACAAGSHEAARFLLMGHTDRNRGGNINAINDNGETPLTVALRLGPMETLMETTTLLLGHGANPNSNGKDRSPLYAALSRGHHDVVHLLQRHGADPNSRDDGGKTLLHTASVEGDLKVAQGLLELGADINSRDNKGRTPLYVIQWNSDYVALLLLEHGADPGARDDDGETPLHVASRSGSLKFAQRLLELGVGVNPRDNIGRTPLHVISWDSEEVALLLLEHGADPGVRDDDGATPLHVASRSGRLKVAQRLMELGVSVNLRDNKGRTPLHVIQSNSGDLALLLLEHGADPDVRDDNGETPLHVASRSGSLKFAQRLLELGVGVNARDNIGRTPLHAIQSKSGDVALLLLEHGADPGVRDNDGETPLHAASRSGCLKFAQQLLELGVGVNPRDNIGRTPLHVIPWDSEDVALLLLEHGADPGVRDDDGETPLHVASRSGRLKVAQRLLELGVSVNSHDNQGRTPLHMIQWEGSGDVALLLLENGADPGVRDDDGQTPLHAASRSGRLKFAWRLLEFGVGVNSRDNTGRTPLHVTQWNSDDVALLLLEHGADPGVRDDDGQTLLHVASRLGSLKFAQRLLEFGVGVNSLDNTGRTPLHVIEWWSEDVQHLLLLLEGGADQGIRDNDGLTPLHAIARWGKLKVTQRLLELDLNVNSEDYIGRTYFDRAVQWCGDVSRLLLERGADPGALDNIGQTPLHVASREGNLSVAQQLLKFDVDVNSHDHQGRTPFHMAVEGGHDEVEKLLLEHGAERPQP